MHYTKKNILFLLLILVLSCNTVTKVDTQSKIVHQGKFKLDQLLFERVRNAYDENYIEVKNKLKNKGIDINNFELYFRVFKQEKELEIWVKKPNSSFLLVDTFPICTSSGKLGPKRKEGDKQVPEGYYHIDRFNPKSNYHLSLGINYPNASDKILGDHDNLGGDIFIHGKCVTIGCLPMTDVGINSIYIYAVEAQNNGQKSIPVTIFPLRMTSSNIDRLENFEENKSLYLALQSGYNYFEKHHQLPSVVFNTDGSLSVSSNE